MNEDNNNPELNGVNNENEQMGFDVLPGLEDNNIQNNDADFSLPGLDVDPYQGMDEMFNEPAQDFNPYGDLSQPMDEQAEDYNMYQEPVQPMDEQAQDFNMYQEPVQPMDEQAQDYNMYQEPVQPMDEQAQDYNMYQEPAQPVDGPYTSTDNMYQEPVQPMNAGVDEYQQPQDYNYNMNVGDGDISATFERTWMGALYEKANSKKFNWCAALFGPAYLMYRKMYLTGFMVLVLELVLMVIASVLSTSSPVVGMVLSLVVTLGVFFGLGLGFYGIYKSFIKGKLNAFRKQTNDTNQLLSMASQKGGTSALGVLLYFVINGVIVPLVVFMLIGVGLLNFANMFNNSMGNLQNELNQVIEEPINTSLGQFNFADDYYLTYDSSEWFLDDVSKTLTKGDYTLTYVGAFTSEQHGLDLSSADGRATLLDYMVTSFTAQLDQTQMQIDTGNRNFIPQDDCYYDYIDFISANAIQRYYFVVLPEDNILFQFTLEINDTSIDSTTNISVIGMLTSIVKEELSAFDNDLGLVNGIVDGNTVSNTLLSNEVTTGLQNTVSNEVAVNTVTTTNEVSPAGATNEVAPQGTNQTTNAVALSDLIQ